MPIIPDPIIRALEKAISEPRGNFEESKKFTVKSLLRPAIFIMGSEAVIIGVLGAIKNVKLGFAGFAAELAGSASDNMLLLAIMVILSFVSVLGVNLYYAHLANKSHERLSNAVAEANRKESYRILVSEFEQCCSKGQKGKSRLLASWIVNRYSNELESDPSILPRILDNIDDKEISTSEIDRVSHDKLISGRHPQS